MITVGTQVMIKPNLSINDGIYGCGIIRSMLGNAGKIHTIKKVREHRGFNIYNCMDTGSVYWPENTLMVIDELQDLFMPCPCCGNKPQIMLPLKNKITPINHWKYVNEDQLDEIRNVGIVCETCCFSILKVIPSMYDAFNFWNNVVCSGKIEEWCSSQL